MSTAVYNRGMACCGRSRGRGPRSPASYPSFVVLGLEGQVVAVWPSRAQAAAEVRRRNAALDQEQVSAGRHFRWELRRVALDGSDGFGEAIRTSNCVGCQDGKVPVQPSEPG